MKRAISNDASNPHDFVLNDGADGTPGIRQTDPNGSSGCRLKPTAAVSNMNSSTLGAR